MKIKKIEIESLKGLKDLSDVLTLYRDKINEIIDSLTPLEGGEQVNNGYSTGKSIPDQELPDYVGKGDGKILKEMANKFSSPSTEDWAEIARKDWIKLVIENDNFEDAGVRLNQEGIADFWIDKLQSQKEELREKLMDMEYAGDGDLSYKAEDIEDLLKS